MAQIDQLSPIANNNTADEPVQRDTTTTSQFSSPVCACVSRFYFYQLSLSMDLIHTVPVFVENSISSSTNQYAGGDHLILNYETNLH